MMINPTDFRDVLSGWFCLFSRWETHDDSGIDQVETTGKPIAVNSLSGDSLWTLNPTDALLLHGVLMSVCSLLFQQPSYKAT